MIKSDVFREGEGVVDYLSPDDQVTGSDLTEKEDGGIALSDPSLGISGYVWSCQYTPGPGTISLTNDTTAVTSVILAGIMNVVGLSFAFDANMRPAIGYLDNVGVSKLYYYDTVTEAYTTMTLPAGSTQPRLCHDDKRIQMVLINITDILCFYTREGSLYYRLQRERYQTEHLIATVTPGTRVKKVGMTDQLNLKIELQDGLFVSSP